MSLGACKTFLRVREGLEGEMGNHRDLESKSYYHHQQLCDYYDDASMENT